MRYVDEINGDIIERRKARQTEAEREWKNIHQIEDVIAANAKHERFMDIIYRVIILVCTILQLIVGFEMIHWSKWMTDYADLHWYDLPLLIFGTLMIIVAVSNVIMLRIKTYFEKEYLR